MLRATQRAPIVPAPLHHHLQRVARLHQSQQQEAGPGPFGGVFPLAQDDALAPRKSRTARLMPTAFARSERALDRGKRWVAVNRLDTQYGLLQPSRMRADPMLGDYIRLRVLHDDIVHHLALGIHRQTELAEQLTYVRTILRIAAPGKDEAFGRALIMTKSAAAAREIV